MKKPEPSSNRTLRVLIPQQAVYKKLRNKKSFKLSIKTPRRERDWFSLAVTSSTLNLLRIEPCVFSSLSKQCIRNSEIKKSFNLSIEALRRERDSNPRYRFQYDSLANCSFRPLRHLSFI